MDAMDPHIASLLDDLLEIDIQRAAKQLEISMAMANSIPEGPRRNLARSDAQVQRLAMERLIGQRRPERVAQMEQSRGLSR